jgi:hypothetical protein
MKWELTASIEIKLHNAIEYERTIWHEYSLAGIFPRSIPEYIPDDVIGLKLRECQRDNELPWIIDDSDPLYPKWWR